MWSTLQTLGGFISRNRTKIAVASVIAIGVTLYLAYTAEPEAEGQRERVEDEERAPTLKFSDESSISVAASRKRLLFKASRQFDTTASQFLPTLRVKVVEVIDINGTVKHIKDLRAKATTDKDELETKLWTEIKNSSFSMLVVSAYMLCAVCTLLRIQLHILGRSLHKKYEADGKEEDLQLDGEKFRLLIEGTYKHLFGAGLRALTERVKSVVATSMAEWSVKEKLHVEHDEIVLMFALIRHHLESDMSDLISAIFIPPEALVLPPLNLSSSFSSPQKIGGVKAGNEAVVQTLLDQTWDVLECPAFHTVYREAVDRCFQQLQCDLYRNVFFPDTQPASPGQPVMRTPPLASLLPQIKSLAGKLLLAGPEGGPAGGTVGEPASLSEEIREISTGPYLDAFCLAVFDAGGP